MIVETKVGGRPALAMYMNEEFEPVDKMALATLVKVTFTDDEGGTLFLVPKAHTDLKPTEKSYRTKFDPNQPRDEEGKWTSGGGDGGGAAATAPKPAAAEKPRATGKAAKGADDRVSTRVPFAKGAADPHGGQDLKPDFATLKGAMSSNKAMREGVGKLLDGYTKGGGSGTNAFPGFLRVAADATPEQKAEALVEHAKSNIVALYDAQKSDFRERSKEWYVGANKIANDFAKTYDVSPRAAAAAIASLSPQKDWDQNVELASRVLDAYKNRDVKFEGAAAAKTKARMAAFSARLRTEADAFEAKLPEAKTERETKDLNLKISNRRAGAAALDRISNELEGKSLSQFPNKLDQARIVRFHDEATGAADRKVGIWNPDGTPSGKWLETAKGAPEKAAWNSFPDIAKALSVVEDDSRNNISERLGGNHKVRNFYNNIISPDYGTDATIDTHAIAAAVMMPVGGNHPLVKNGLGMQGPKNADTGLKALYSIYFEAYQRAAAEVSAKEGREVLPREMQSSAWEAVRGLWSEVEKRDPKEKERVNAIWERYQRGEIDIAAAAKDVLSRGIKPPRWAA